MSSDPLWLKPGVGSGEVAAVVGCAAKDDELPLVLWARIVTRIELQEIKRMQKLAMEQGTPQWLTWRDGGVGGSEVASVVGAEYKRKENKADYLWRKKLPKDDPRRAGEQVDSERMAHGRRYEGEARQLYEALYGWSVSPLCVIHDEHSFVRVSLDGLRPDDQLVAEIKCCGERNHAKLLELSRIPEPFERQTAFAHYFNYYRYQTLYQMAVTGASCCHLIGYSPHWPDAGDRLAIVEVYPEPAEQERLIQRVVEFWGYVERRECPSKEWLVPTWRLPEEVAVPE